MAARRAAAGSASPPRQVGGGAGRRDSTLVENALETVFQDVGPDDDHEPPFAPEQCAQRQDRHDRGDQAQLDEPSRRWGMLGDAHYRYIQK